MTCLNRNCDTPVKSMVLSQNLRALFCESSTEDCHILSTTDTSGSIVSVGHMAHEAEYLEPQLGLAAHSKLMLFESSEKWNRNLDYGAFKIQGNSNHYTSFLVL